MDSDNVAVSRWSSEDENEEMDRTAVTRLAVPGASTSTRSAGSPSVSQHNTSPDSTALCRASIEFLSKIEARLKNISGLRRAYCSPATQSRTPTQARVQVQAGPSQTPASSSDSPVCMCPWNSPCRVDYVAQAVGRLWHMSRNNNNNNDANVSSSRKPPGDTYNLRSSNTAKGAVAEVTTEMPALGLPPSTPLKGLSNTQTPASTNRGLKRKLADNEKDEYKLNQNLLRLLECPVCMEWMEPPMAQCRRGHLVCAPCRARLTNCPVCRNGFSTIRNHSMESVAEAVQYPCRYGCGSFVHLKQRERHEHTCPRRPHRCPVPQCKQSPLQYAALQDHILNVHKAKVKKGCRQHFKVGVGKFSRDVTVVMAHQEIFYVVLTVNKRAGAIFGHVAYVGHDSNASKYTYQVTLASDRNNGKIVYSRHTHDELEDVSTDSKKSNCFCIGMDQLSQFQCEKYRLASLDIAVHIMRTDVFEADNANS